MEELKSHVAMYEREVLKGHVYRSCARKALGRCGRHRGIVRVLRRFLYHLDTIASNDAIDQDTRVQDVESDDKGSHRCTIKGDEVSLGLDDTSGPTASEFDSTIDASHDDEKN